MSRLDMPLGARKDNTHADDSGPWRTLRGARFAQYPVWAKGLPGSDRPDSSLWGLTAKASVESGRHTLADPYPAGGRSDPWPPEMRSNVDRFGFRMAPNAASGRIVVCIVALTRPALARARGLFCLELTHLTTWGSEFAKLAGLVGGRTGILS
jgi:hypothetical protein